MCKDIYCRHVSGATKGPLKKQVHRIHPFLTGLHIINAILATEMMPLEEARKLPCRSGRSSLLLLGRRRVLGSPCLSALPPLHTMYHLGMGPPTKAASLRLQWEWDSGVHEPRARMLPNGGQGSQKCTWTPLSVARSYSRPPPVTVHFEEETPTPVRSCKFHLVASLNYLLLLKWWKPTSGPIIPSEP